MVIFNSPCQAAQVNWTAVFPIKHITFCGFRLCRIHTLYTLSYYNDHHKNTLERIQDEGNYKRSRLRNGCHCRFRI